MIEIVEFDTLCDGPTLVLTGGVHGNEPCGVIALNEFIDSVRSGRTKLQKGRIICMPLCNPKAHAHNVRYIDRNLNRSLYRKDIKFAYEDYIDPVLCDIFDRADYVVDLHSFTVGEIPYVLIENEDAHNVEFASSLGLDHLVYGWAAAYAASGGAVDPLENQGTTEYARLNGAIAVTVECGQHTDPRSVDVARRVIRNVLAHLEFTAGKTDPTNPTIHHITRTFFKQKDGDFTREWVNMEPVRAGTVLACYADGEEVVMAEDGIILLTKPWARAGEEWFCTGKAKPA